MTLLTGLGCFLTKPVLCLPMFVEYESKYNTYVLQREEKGKKVTGYVKNKSKTIQASSPRSL